MDHRTLIYIHVHIWSIFFIWNIFCICNRTIILKVPASQASAIQTTQQQATPEVGKTKLENLRAALAATINKVQSSQTYTTTTEVTSQSNSIGTPPKVSCLIEGHNFKLYFIFSYVIIFFPLFKIFGIKINCFR